MSTADKFRSHLVALSSNLWWSWNPDIIKLFRDLAPEDFRASNHNPVLMLGELTPDQIGRLAKDAAVRARVDAAHRELIAYLDEPRTWASVHAAPLRVRPVAYFSAEFGIHESLPIYSGGLGVLAGDHLKTASDLAIPLVGIGLFYGQGYFRQRLDRDGWQQEEYIQNDVNQLPMEPAIAANGEPVVVQIETRTGSI